LLQDASFNAEQWLFQKVSEGSILVGNGLGMPLGLLHPQAGVPIKGGPQ
jgi:hypothetical protein